MSLKTSILQLLIFLLPYLAGLKLLISWRKKKVAPDLFFFSMLWTLLLLAIYVGFYEVREGSFYLAIPLVSFLLFLGCYFYNKPRLVNGFLFNLFLVISGAYLLYNFYLTKNATVLLLLAVVGMIGLALVLFGLVSLIILLYWNAMVVIRRESHSLANLLTLILAIFLTLLLIYDTFVANRLPDWATSLASILPIGLTYFAIIFLNFLTVSILYQFNHPRYRQDFIIVLGAGLLNGETVTPLLARRIDCAITFYQAQKEHSAAPKLVMSGGQGADEKVSEAVAMKQYALEKNIPSEDILIETNSTTTFENMKFSNEIIQKQKKAAHVIFASNNYHIFRAGMFARKAGLRADGIGAKTALYYLPNAFLREFIAIIAMNKKRHLVILLTISLILLLLTLIAILPNFWS